MVNEIFIEHAAISLFQKELLQLMEKLIGINDFPTQLRTEIITDLGIIMLKMAVAQSNCSQSLLNELIRGK